MSAPPLPVVSAVSGVAAAGGEVADAVALVLERRAREVPPAPVLALALREPRRRHLQVAVDRDVPEIGRALDVDQDLDRLDRPGRERHLVARRGERCRGEGVGRRAVGVDCRDHVVAAEEEGPRRRVDVEARRAALALARARERERGGGERRPSRPVMSAPAAAFVDVGQFFSRCRTPPA